MQASPLPGLLLALMAGVALVAVLARGADRTTARLLWLAFALRVVGAAARYWVLVDLYQGVGDATSYYLRGLVLAESIEGLDFSFLENFKGAIGTFTVHVVSGFVLAAIGPSMIGDFVVFALLPLVGLWLMARAFQDAEPDPAQQSHTYLALLAVTPSLWYWPSSIGKEALLLLGLGLVTYGYVGRVGIRWSSLIAGFGICALARPHIAAIVAIACLASEILAGDTPWGPRRISKLAVLCLGALYLTVHMAASFRFDLTDLTQLEEFQAYAAQQTVQGKSKIEAVTGVAALPLGLVNVFFRPFPWEAHNGPAALAAFELVVLWSFAWRRRDRLLAGLKSWRSNRALRFALPCGLLLAMAYGVTFFNLGILARQRVAAFALLLMVFGAAAREPEARPTQTPSPSAEPRLRPRWRGLPRGETVV